MNKNIYLSVICALAIHATASDLGTIQVESSTIDDKFDTKAFEISSTATMQGSEVETFHAENIADVLNSIPGVTARKNEGDSNKIHIRGIATEMYMGEKPGVAIVIDGVPVQERAGSVNIDIDNIESLKVIKGGASYLYGNDALAGAIIITTKRPKNKNELLVTTEQASYGYQKYLANYNAGTENFALNVQGSYKKSDGYWENSDYWAKSLNGKLQYYIDDSSDITIGVDKSTRYENDTGSITHSTYNKTTGLYTNNIETNPTSAGEVGFATNYDITLDKYFITYSNDLSNNSNLMAQVYKYEDTTKNRTNPYDSNTDGVKDDHTYNAYANTDQLGLKSEFRRDGEEVASMLGVDIARNNENKNTKYRVDVQDYDRNGLPTTFHPTGEIASDTSSKENINAIYGELKHQLIEDFVVTINARYDKIAYDYTNNLNSLNWKKDFFEQSYRAGATYELADKQIIFANISTGFRVPTLDQLYAGDMITSTYSGTYVNNTDIKTEKTYNFEIGFRYKTDLLSYEASVFQLERKDVIGKSSGNYASTRGVNVYYDNMADIQNRGLEFSVNSDKSRELSFVFAYTYLHSKYTRYDAFTLILNDQTTGRDYVEGVYNLAENVVPRTSNHTVYLEGNYRVIPKLMLTADVNYRSAQFADELNEIKVDGYSVVNLRANYNTQISDFNIEVFAKIENVLDEKYYMMPRATGDRNDDGLYDIRDMGLTVNPGRVYLAGLCAKF
ncbi:TonB-dependent receptor [bacterium]|nr:TonB-dependent receptor [bacterium]MBU1994073.1 TonB-dependent receptor [bacterium]